MASLKPLTPAEWVDELGRRLKAAEPSSLQLRREHSPNHFRICDVTVAEAMRQAYVEGMEHAAEEAAILVECADLVDVDGDGAPLAALDVVTSLAAQIRSEYRHPHDDMAQVGERMTEEEQAAVERRRLRICRMAAVIASGVFQVAIPKTPLHILASDSVRLALAIEADVNERVTSPDDEEGEP